jgi:hypothetical protein
MKFLKVKGTNNQPLAVIANAWRRQGPLEVEKQGHKEQAQL